MNDLPGKIMVWHGPHPLPHAGSWATTRYPQEAEEYVKVAALPGMVQPLEFWVSDTGDLICDSLIGRYQIQKCGARWCCMKAMGNKHRPAGDDAPTFHKSENGAKIAAQKHYSGALTLAAFGVQGGET